MQIRIAKDDKIVRIFLLNARGEDKRVDTHYAIYDTEIIWDKLGEAPMNVPPFIELPIDVFKLIMFGGPCGIDVESEQQILDKFFTSLPKNSIFSGRHVAVSNRCP